MGKDEWLTPLYILEALGDFDLDPCAPDPSIRPWATAKSHLHVNGLEAYWSGRVWCNPPYGQETGKWLHKLADHGRGTALIFARTETIMFFDQVWDRATGLLFLFGRVRFYHVDGTPGDSTGGAPSVLVAYSEKDAEILDQCSLSGCFIKLS